MHLDKYMIVLVWASVGVNYNNTFLNHFWLPALQELCKNKGGSPKKHPSQDRDNLTKIKYKMEQNLEIQVILSQIESLINHYCLC